jgi:hypothetical protein
MRVAALPQLISKKFTASFTSYSSVAVTKITGIELGDQVSNPGRGD